MRSVPHSLKSKLTHGLYARRLTKEEVELLGAAPVLDIDGEIAYQRALINRLGQILENNGLAADSTGELSAESRGTIKLLNEVLGRLLTYLRMRNMLKGDLSEFREEIERGKMIGRIRMGVLDYFKPPPAEPEDQDKDRGAHDLKAADTRRKAAAPKGKRRAPDA